MPFLPVRVLANIMRVLAKSFEGVFSASEGVANIIMRVLANLMRASVFSASEGDY